MGSSTPQTAEVGTAIHNPIFPQRIVPRNPGAGIRAAIRTFYDPRKKISIYVFGDEYSGTSIQPVIDEVSRINRAGAGGERLVRIHAVGFPVLVADRRGIGATGQRFATLMRALCQKNGGTFVGLNSINP